MAQVTPPSITPAPLSPDRADRTTFSTRATVWADWLKNSVSQFQALATNVYDNAVDSYNSAINSLNSASASANSAASALSSANAAASISGAAAWVNGNTYALNSAAISGLDFQTYRKITASSVTTIDPSLDDINWVSLGTSAFAIAASILPQGVL